MIPILLLSVLMVSEPPADLNACAAAKEISARSGTSYVFGEGVPCGQARRREFWALDHPNTDEVATAFEYRLLGDRYTLRVEKDRTLVDKRDDPAWVTAVRKRCIAKGKTFQMHGMELPLRDRLSVDVKVDAQGRGQSASIAPPSDKDEQTDLCVVRAALKARHPKGEPGTLRVPLLKPPRTDEDRWEALGLDKKDSGFRPIQPGDVESPGLGARPKAPPDSKPR